MPESDEQRTTRASDLAYKAGQIQAETTGQLKSHENRLNALNGNIKRQGDTNAQVANELQGLGHRFDQFLAEQTTAKAVQHALTAQLKDAADKQTEQIKAAADKQISGRAFGVGIATVVLMMLGVIVSVLLAVHGL